MAVVGVRQRSATALRRRVDALVPRKLTVQQWDVRHRVVLGSVVVPAAPLAVLVFDGALPAELATTYALLVVLQAVLALVNRVSPMVRQVFAVGCLFTACATLVEASDRSPAAHLFFALALCMVTLYQDAVIYLGAVAVLALYHLGIGLSDPSAIYHPSVRADVLVWSSTFFLMALATSLVGVLTWTLNARGVRESEALKVALTEAGLRERQARDINDSVVQHLVTAVYADEVGDPDAARTATRQALVVARKLVVSLLAPSWLRDRVLLRDDPSQDADDRGHGDG